MQEASTKISIDQLLGDLAQALLDERNALVQVDAEEIDLAAARKATLTDQLARYRDEFSDAHRTKLALIQTEVRHNLILLVHARDYVQSRLGILTGRPAIAGQLHPSRAESVRLDLRG